MAPNTSRFPQVSFKWQAAEERLQTNRKLKKELKKLNEEIRVLEKGLTMITRRIDYHSKKRMVHPHQIQDLIKTEADVEKRLVKKRLERREVEDKLAELHGSRNEDLDGDLSPTAVPTSTQAPPDSTEPSSNDGGLAAAASDPGNLPEHVTVESAKETLPSEVTDGLISGTTEEDIAELQRLMEREKLMTDIEELRMRRKTNLAVHEAAIAEAHERKVRAALFLRSQGLDPFNENPGSGGGSSVGAASIGSLTDDEQLSRQSSLRQTMLG